MNYSSVPAFDSDCESIQSDASDSCETTASIPLHNLNVTIPLPPDPAESPKSLASIASSIEYSGITQGRLIKLVGLPPESDETNSEEEDSPCLRDVRDVELPIQPPVVTMGADEKGRPIVDVINSLDEDPFTLDSYELMIRKHAAKGKDFLLARVVTVDPQDEARFYYSYYSAHHINKVLFRTQPEEGLLHRMKAKNPLNNMVIIGDVHYYVIKALSVNVALATNRNASSPIPVASASITDDEKNHNDHIDEALLATVAQRLSQKVHRFLQMTGIEPNQKNRKLRLIMKPEGLLEPMNKKDKAPSASGPILERQNTVDDVADLQEQHEPKTVLAHLDKFVTYLKGLSDESETEPNVDYCNDFEVLFARYQTEVNGRELFRRKVRSSSFINDFGRNNVLSFEDWLKAFEQEKILGMEGNSVSGSMKFRKAVSPHNSTTIKIESPTSPDSKKLYYIAEYLASDDDFLMKSSVRANFRENALESDDAVLFTLMGAGTSPTEDDRAVEQHPALRDFVYSFEDGTGWSVTSKSFKLFLFSYFILSVVIVNFFVPGEFTYIASFSFIFFLCLLLIIVL